MLETQEYSTWVKRANLNEAQAGDWLRIGVYAYMKGEHRFWNREHSPDLLVEVHDENGNLIRWTNLKISSHITKDANYSIWHPGDINMWDEAAYYIYLPKNVNDNWSVKAYIWNQRGNKIYLDDFKIDLFREK